LECGRLEAHSSASLSFEIEEDVEWGEKTVMKEKKGFIYASRRERSETSDSPKTNLQFLAQISIFIAAFGHGENETCIWGRR
jgi:hypothetical protein